MSSAANTAWKAVKPHIPLIKFRKGKLTPHNDQTTVNNTKKIIVLDESQLPAKYARKPVSQLEIEFIERGGPE